MGVIDEPTIARIKSQLRHHPKGMMISDLSHGMNINRNIMAKYLEILRMAGQVEMETRGNAKVYTLSKRAPLSALFESSSDCILLLDETGKILWVNTPVLTLSGKKAGEIEGMQVSAIDNPFFAHLPHGETSESSETVAEITFEQNGEAKYYRVKKVPAVLADGGNGSILSCEDITLEIVFQQMVERSEARFRAIVEDQTEFIARYQPDGKITFVNGSCARFFKKRPEEMFGTVFFSLFGQEGAEVLRARGLSLDPDHPHAVVECNAAGPGGVVRQQQWTVRALFDKVGRIAEYQVVGRDITDQAAAQARTENHISTMEFLSRTGKAFMDMGEEEDIYEYIAREVFSLAPGFLVWVGILDHSEKFLCLKGVAGNPVALDTMRQLTGKNVRDMVFSIDKADTARLIRHRTLVKTPPLFRLLHMQVQEEVCRQIEEASGGIDSYLIGLVSKGKILGDVGISLPAGSDLPGRELIEAFIQQAAIAIEKRIAEVTLRESERLYRSVLDNIQDVYYRSDTDGHLIMASPSWAAVLGYDSLEECLGKDIADTFHLDPTRRKEFLDTLYRDGAVRDYELVLKRKDGTPLHIAVSSHVLHDGSGTVIGIEGIFRDITKRHRAEEKNREHLAEMEFLSGKAREFLELSADADIYNAILDGLRELVPDSVMTVSSFDCRTGTIMTRSVWSDEVGTLFKQLTGEDLIGKTFRVTDPDALVAMKTGRIRRIPGDVYYTMFGTVPMGISRQIEQSLAMEGDKYAVGMISGDRLLGAILIVPKKGQQFRHRDLIEIYLQQASIALAQRLDADALRQSEARFRAIVEDQTEFVIRFLPDGTLTFVNAPFCRATGLDQKELTGRSFFTMVPADDLRILQDGLQSLSADNPKTTIRHRFIDRQGRTRWFEWTNRVVCNDQGHVVEYDGIGRDITEFQEAMTRICTHHTDIQFLTENASVFARTCSPEEVRAFMVKSLHTHLPESLVAVCSYSPSRRELSFRCLEGHPEDLRILRHELGTDLTTTIYPYKADAKILSLMRSRQVVPVHENFSFFFSQGIQDPAARIFAPCNFGRSYIMGLPSQDGTIETVLLQLKADADLQKPEIVEAVINLAGQALDRVQDE
jgi:PAS domain S-box-containing protein